jgi:hypothetical protein
VKQIAPLIALLVLIGCRRDGYVWVEGTVADVAGLPIRNASVRLAVLGRSGLTTRTDALGHFFLRSTIAPGNYSVPLLVEADGLKGAHALVQTISHNIVRVRLVPSDSIKKSLISLARTGPLSGASDSHARPPVPSPVAH